ncbi:MAG: hypothetical protein ACUVQT_09030, partial [bacterium]
LHMFFWILVFFIPTPKNYRIEDILSQNESSKQVDSSTYTLALEAAKKYGDGKKYVFEANTENKRNGSLFLVSLLTFVLIFFQIIIFHKKSYISFPMVTATVVAYFFYSVIWLFMNSIPSEIYTDITNIRERYKGILIFQFLGLNLIVFAMVIIMENWYKLKDIN